MTTFKPIRVGNLRNAEHFQFMTEFRDLVQKSEPVKQRLNRAFNTFLQLFAKEDECLLVLQKSYYTARLEEADVARDLIFRGMADAVKSQLNHFNAQKRDAAQQIEVLLNGYGNLVRKPYDEETAGISNLIDDLTQKYNNQVQLLALVEWVNELRQKNVDFETVMKSRDTESSEKPSERLIEVRAEIDATYRAMTQAVESLELMANDDNEARNYTTFIDAMNAVITRYADRLAQREGRNKEEESPLTPEGGTETV